ncbi:MAG TPA: terminase family protein, partial [Phycisphaerae bacterium]|nr:terminase family protein [Phycisphaerae bacterium]
LKLMGNMIAQTVFDGGHLIVNLPPRHGKSELISFWTPVWFLDNFPDRNIILSSYGAELAEGFGRRVKNELQNNTCCRAKLSVDSKSSARLNTSEGGGMYSVGVGGPLSGRGGHLMIIDDPYKNWEDSHSPAYRQTIRDWYRSTFRSRLEPGGAIIIAMTRWADDDLCGWLLEEFPEDWRVLSLPAIAGENDVLDRKTGEALCRQRFDEEKLAQLRKESGSIVWDAMYQQKPKPMGIGVIYCNFSAANIDTGCELIAGQPLHVSFDFNIDPGMHAEIGQYDNKADIFTCCHEIYDDRLSVRGAMERFLKWFNTQNLKFPEIHVFGDASGDNEWAGTAESCYTIVRQYLDKLSIQYRMRVMKKNPPVLERINTFNEALCDVDKKIHYRVHPRCKRLIADFKKLKSDAGGLIDKREHALSHASDAEGYRVHYLRPLRSVSKMKDEARFIVSST